MKALFLFLFVILFLYAELNAQTYTGDLTLTSQPEVDAFNYTSVTGILRIEEQVSGNISNLNGLSELTSVGSFLRIYNNSSLADINGLSNLSSVGHLYILNNDALTNVNAFSNLTSNGGNLLISGNSSLTDLDGFSNLISIGGFLEITSNNSITNIDGLSNLTSNGGFLSILSNPFITNLNALSNLDSIPGQLNISNMNALTSIDGLLGLTYVGASLVISDNPALTNINGLSNVISVGELNSPGITCIHIIDNVTLTEFCGLYKLFSSGFVNGPSEISGNVANPTQQEIINGGSCTSTVYNGDLILTTQAEVDAFRYTSVTGSLTVNDAVVGNITNLNGLSELTSLGQGLYIYNNASLNNLDGLSNLTSVGGDLTIEGNNSLTNVNGLSNLTSANSLSISNNSALVNIDGLSALTTLGGSFGGGLNIESNSALTSVDGLSNLTTVPGDLIIQDNDTLSNIDGLSNLSLVGGHLGIWYNGALTNIDGLSNLNSVESGLSILENPSLTNINGFFNLSSVVGDLYIQNNSVLTNFCGLYTLLTTPFPGGLNGDFSISGNGYNPSSQSEIIDGGSCTSTVDLILTTQAEVDAFNYNSVTGSLIILNGADIINLDGLSELTSVGAALSLLNNTVLNDIDGLSNLSSIGSHLVINNNNALPNLDGLSLLSSVGEHIQIFQNSALDNLDGLSNLISVGGQVDITDNDALININGLSNLISIGFNFVITDNDALTNLDGLSSLISVGDFSIIQNNDALASINGLSGLESIEGDLIIQFNNALVNIYGLTSLDSIGEDLIIRDNVNLFEFCWLYPLLFNNGLGGNYFVINNGANPTVQEILSDCVPNQPPVAVCQDVTVISGGNGQADVTPEEINNGSSDPDNDSLTFSLDPSGPYSIGVTPVVLTVSDGQESSFCSAVITVNESAVILATNSVWFEAGADVLSGNVIVNNVSSGPTLDSGVELSVGAYVTTPPEYSLKANRIKVKQNAVVNSDLFYNYLTNNGSISGSLNSPLTLPVYNSLPPFHQQSPGTQNITVPVNGFVTLSAGDYGNIVVKKNGKLLFTGGGTFSINNLNTVNKAKLLFDAPAEVLIANKFDTDVNSSVGPSNGSGIDASDIVFYIAGINGSNGNINASPKAAQVGLNNEIFANFYVPNGTLWLRGSSEATGSFIAKDIMVGVNVKVSEDNAFSGTSLAKFGSGQNNQEGTITIQVPEEFGLLQNYPNPFNPSTVISWQLPVSSYVSLKVYDVLGNEVAELVDENKEAGFYETRFDGSTLASGIYVYRLMAGSYVSTRKMLMIK